MGSTKVTRNYQITIPKDVRKLENVLAGDELLVESRGGEIVVKKAALTLSREEILKKSFGAWGKGPRGLVTIRKLRKESEKRWKRMGI